MPPLIIPEPDDVNSGLGSGLFREAGYHSSIRLSMLSLFGGLLPGWHHWWPQSTGQHRRTQPVSSFCSACQGSAPTPAGLNRPMRLLAVGIMEKWPPKKTCGMVSRIPRRQNHCQWYNHIYIYLYYNHIYIICKIGGVVLPNQLKLIVPSDFRGIWHRLRAPFSVDVQPTFLKANGCEDHYSTTGLELFR